VTTSTLPQFLLRNAREFPDAPAMREKDRGIWQEWTWAEYLARVRAIALGLVKLGFQRGDKLAALSDNRPQLYATLLAAQAVGGVAVPLYQDSIARELRYVIDHADAKFVLAEDQEQVDKLLELKASLPKVEKVFYADPKGLRDYADPILMPLEELEQRGRAAAAERPELFEALVSAGRAEDIAVLSYTSGTTGAPKGAMLSHANYLAAVRGILEVERFERTDEVLAYLPLAWIGESFFSLGCALVVGFTVNCPERAETVLENLKEIGPQIVLAPPRGWENLVSTVQVRMEDASWLKRRLYSALVPAGEEAARREMEKQPISSGLWLRRAIGEALVFAPLRDRLGLRRARYAYTGGAPLGPEVFLFFRGIGLNLKQVYGQTETTGLSCVQRDGDVKLGTVGKPYPSVEVRLSDTGEVVSRGPTTFVGYYKNPEATAQAMRDGWLQSGDAAMLDPDGHLIVIDRVKDVTTLADGTKFAPQFIENKLKFSPYVKEAVAVGQDRPHVAAMINIDMENVGKWAERRAIAYTTYADLAQKRAVYDLIGREVERVNRDLPDAARIRKYVLLHKELDPDDDEVTRTRKVRRGFIASKYADIIAALYSAAPSVAVTTTITYQDGRQATLQTELAIRSAGAGFAAAAAA
jgi:long-chain acyl-CoA synthetase